MRERIKGRVLRQGDKDFDRIVASTSFNARPVGERAVMLVEAADAEDAALAVRIAKREGLKVAVKSGGHSWSANHIRDGAMIIDVARLDEVEIDNAAMIARAGPGAPGSETMLALLKRGLFFPAGHCEGVRLGGYLLQGGFGWNGRHLGPACESVSAIDYVDANGDMRHASATQNADMLWAARGAGPGFFGVVTRFHLKLYRKPKHIAMTAAVFPLARALDVFRWAHDNRREIPPSIELNILTSRHIPWMPGGGVLVTFTVFEDGWRQAREAVRLVRSLPKGAAYRTPLLPTPMKRMYRGVMEHYPHHHNYAVDNMWTHAAFDDLAPGLKRIVETLPPAPSHMLWMNWTPPRARADMAFSMEDDIYIALYGVWKDESRAVAAGDWAASRMREMAPLATGVQLADENIGARPAAFMKPENLARLDSIRAARDPEGRFFDYRGRP